MPEPLAVLDGQVLPADQAVLPVTDPGLRQRLIDECLVAYLHDGKDAWDLGPDGAYVRVGSDTHAGEEGASRTIEAHGAQSALMGRYASRGLSRVATRD